MLRLRRYRVFVACAFVFVFLFYRVSVNSAWDSNNFDYRQAAVQPNPQPQAAERDQAQKPLAEKPQPAVEDTFAQDVEEEKVKIPNLKTTTELKDGFALPPAPTLEEPLAPLDEEKRPAQEPPAPTEPPTPLIPDRRPGKVGDAYPHAVDEPLHFQDPPGRYQGSPVATTTSTTIHWEKQPEWFPVPEDSLIPLPTGKPKPVPRVQYNFGSESPDAKAKREDRLAEVKAEMKRAWDGYEKYAFGHDELVPIEKSFKDPFCGWAATLVDAMDTLWIMGLKEEFDTAYKALKDIDFTTTPHRNEIPVFETTIRYLGGLLAAYDVSGGHKGHYPLLLKKAVELAEVLMGIFDTPNRMPVLYYKWKPAYASQPKRASTRAGIAELGTLSMEFTRLAQLTDKDKYYDAIARITDALEEWQNRDDETAPTLPGIFPENVDTSGCNSSATSAHRQASLQASLQAQLQAETAQLEDPQGYVPPAAGSSDAWDVSSQGRPTVEFQVKPGGEGSPDVGAFRAVEKRQVGDYTPESGVPPRNPNQVPEMSPPHRAGASSRFQSLEGAEPLGANGLPADWDCVASNLTAAPGMEMFSMGGSQDSAYEYFPKQYLLLGGLEPKYRTLHEKTVAAVKKWLLFRPMVPDDPEILFSAKVRISSGTDRPLSERMDYEYEVTHLTCFLGGMFGLGAKIFDSPEDLEIGKRLTDGCVWAYFAMPSGIMPEYAHVAPCSDTENCQWNETLWTDQYLDPNPEWRVQQMESYRERLQLWETEKQQAIRDEAVRLQAAEEKARQTLYPGETGSKAGIAQEPGVPAGYGGADRDGGSKLASDKPAGYGGVDRDGGSKSASEKPASDEDGYPRRKGSSSPPSNADGSPRRDDDVASRPAVQKRDFDDEASLLPTPDTSDNVTPAATVDPATLDQQAIKEKMRKLEAELNRYDETTGRTSSSSSSSGAFGGTVGQMPIDQAAINLPPRPVKPATHEEYVQNLIVSEGLPPGFTRIGDKRYILR
jgi:mannosyl-oligosaccharide alpha-1,2-mannosidase